MKKLLLTLGLIGCTVASALAQGTIAFGNSALTRIKLCDGQALRNATAADGLSISVWFGPAGSSADALTQVGAPAAIGSTPGVMVNAPSVFAIPGTEPNQVVSLQIRASSPMGLSMQTKVAQVTLGQTAGPGAVIWQTSDTNPNRFTPLGSYCPEPSTLTLGAVAGIFLVFRARNVLKTK